MGRKYKTKPLHVPQQTKSASIWHGLNKQEGLWAKACIPCQSSKIQQHIRALLEIFKVLPRRFDHMHVDLVGPLPLSNGHTHLLTVVDRCTRWPEAIPLSNPTTLTCAQALVTNWIASFGAPIDMSSDRCSQFTSQLWADISQLRGTKLSIILQPTTLSPMA